MNKPLIAVVGGTGAQGGGVVEALLQRGRFAVRVLTRDPDSARARALAARGVALVRADLNDPASLPAAFEGAHGVFLVTNFWDPSTGANEAATGEAAVGAAKAAGVRHLIWSTLPNVRALTDGALHVHHFTNKAVVDRVVAEAGFPHHTFVEAPMYFQNFTSMMGPQPLPTGQRGWAVPMDPSRRCIHLGDVADVGRVVARAFEQPERVGRGTHLGVASGATSWNEIVETLNAQGHALAMLQVPAAVYDGFFPGAEELREMFQWFERATYFGPDAEEKLAATRAVHPEPLTRFADWAATHLPAGAVTG